MLICSYSYVANHYNDHDDDHTVLEDLAMYALIFHEIYYKMWIASCFTLLFTAHSLSIPIATYLHNIVHVFIHSCYTTRSLQLPLQCNQSSIILIKFYSTTYSYSIAIMKKFDGGKFWWMDHSYIKLWWE